MSNTHSLLDRVGLDAERARQITADALSGADDGELFLEYRQSEALVFDDGKLKTANMDTSQGFGLRGVSGELSSFAHASEISEAAIKRAANAVSSSLRGAGGTYAETPRLTNSLRYGDENPLEAPDFAEKVTLLQDIDAYLRDKNDLVQQVSVSLSGQYQIVEILRPDGRLVQDVRPLVRLNISVIAEKDGRRESGSSGGGGRRGYGQYIAPDAWQATADEALRQALVNLEAQPAPAGALDVVLGPGWPGILLHEAVGHGLEGDFNRKGTSAFAGLVGERVAAPGVTVVDDGTYQDRRGSITIDDEGTPSGAATLIEDGILVGFMQDRQNARLMGVDPTGNGRRQSYAHLPMPRMTNTIMRGGDTDPSEILESVKDGLYAVSFAGGQVDITSGKFVFECTEAYKVENGKPVYPVKGAMLIGSGPDALTRVKMVGNDMELDSGMGTCGKNGQWVPVGVGQPTLRIDALTVGGTAA
ncbi:MAG: metalloprotease TldD [Pseudomonadota bacterium]